MKTQIPLPEVALIAGTRVALGVGIGLLIAHKMNGNQRKTAGWALLAFGAITTVPLVVDVLRNRIDQNDRRIIGD